MGYAQMTSGRQSATASAIACEPSICLSIGSLAFDDHDRSVESGMRGSDIRERDVSGEFLVNRRRDRFDRYALSERGERSQQRRIRHRPTNMLQRNLAGGDRAD